MNKFSLIFFEVLLISLIVESCGITYSNDVTIGKQVWMGENLNVDIFRNGDPIREAKTDEEWEKATEEKRPAWCYVKINSESSDQDRKLYNWYAVNDPRGLAPKGWRIPTNEDWSKLTDFLEAETVLKKKSTRKFLARGESVSLANESNFLGLPPDSRAPNGIYISSGNYGGWWSSTEYDAGNAWSRYLGYDNGDFSRWSVYGNKGKGLSVRCLRE
jgi:uncharacterized protein (TIGR02145 family)